MRDERTANYYVVLELLPTATPADIKKAWHEQLQVWHPDRFNHSPALHRKAEARTQLITQAYQTLSDPTLRTRYHPATQNAPSTTPPARPSPPPRPQPPPRSRPAPRGPQPLIMLPGQGKPNTMVPAITMLVDTREHLPYE